MSGFAKTLRAWFDAGALEEAAAPERDAIDWPRVIPFVLLHLGCGAVAWVGVSATALLVAGGLYVARMFALTAFYHRYFSHRAFEIGRLGQFLFACLGAAAIQRGPLWWAAHHRDHHRVSDRPEDVHSPVVHGFWWSHVGWFLSRKNFRTRLENVPDLARYPELRFLDRFDVVVPALLFAALYAAGAACERWWPALETDGWQLVVWGFFVSTVVLYHATFTINSLAHRFGKRRYATADQSRNNGWLALLTLGEGWHNNHHHYPAAARQGFRWHELDVSWLLLRLLAACGIVRALRDVPPAVRDDGDPRGRAGVAP
ncbi:MAG: acyl-CoA desaturase [Planctomycetes bacterium]|nr:acyl-CoA desaturase [Planctomycetota bacterium]